MESPEAKRDLADLQPGMASTSSCSSSISGALSDDSSEKTTTYPFIDSPEDEFIQAGLNLTTVSELNEAVEKCKGMVLDTKEFSEERKWLVRYLIELRLRLEEAREAEVEKRKLDPIGTPDQSLNLLSNGNEHCKTRDKRIILGHHFNLQAPIRTIFKCDRCSTTILGVLHLWYECQDCQYKVHMRCIQKIRRECAYVRVCETPFFSNDICPEVGLVAQGYRCFECKTVISHKNGWCEPRQCDYDGRYYCNKCHWDSTAVIPARVVHNWDFNERKVCCSCHSFLRLMKNRPVLNLDHLNPQLFQFVIDLVSVKKIRSQLLILKPYVSTCPSWLKDKSKKQLLWTLESHFIENSTGVFSLQDLINVNRNTILPFLKEAAHVFAFHIRNCPICKLKGHYCELCSSKKNNENEEQDQNEDCILFPFDDPVIVFVTSSVGLTQTTLANLAKGQESVRILIPTSSQASGGMNINNARLPLTTQHVGALQNGSVALTSLPSQSVVNPATTVVSQNQLSSSANVTKQITQSVLSALDPTKTGGAAVVIKTSGNQLAPQASIASAVMPVPMSVNSSVPMTATSINNVASVGTVTSGTSVVTLAKPLTQSVATIGSQGNVISGNVQILNVNALRPMTPGIGGQKGPLRVVSGSPIVRAGGVQGQITLQALQSLSPGTQNLLIKTDNGFQLVRVGPGTGAATLGGNNANATQTLRLQSFPTLSSVSLASSGTSTATTVTANTITTQVPVPALSTPTTSGSPSVTSAAPVTQQAAQPRPAQVDTTKEKCRKFLANLLELSSREPKSVERNVRSLIQELVDCKVEPEEFCERLERLLNASPQPCLIGFLKKSLPLLRQAMVTKELVIDGIRPPPANVMFTTVVASTISTPTVSCPPLQVTQLKPGGITTQTVRVVTPASAGTTTTVVTPTIIGGVQGPRHVFPHRLVTPLQFVTPGLTGTVNKVFTQSVMTPQVPITTSAPGIVSQTVSSAAVVTTHPSPVASPIPGSTLTTVPVSTSVVFRTGTSGTIQVPRAMMPIRQTAPIRAQNRPLSPVIRTTTPLRATTPLNKTTTIASKGPPKLNAAQLRMQGKPITGPVVTLGASAIVSSSDIVNSGTVSTVLTTMSSTNPAVIQSDNSSITAPNVSSIAVPSGAVSTPVISTALAASVISASEKGLEEPSADVAALISHATQERLKNFVEKLAVIAEHRMDIIKIDPRYEISQDVKGQLKFLEELDRMERKRNEEKERELLLRAAKSRSKSEDPEQAKLKAKAKEMQRAEMEEVRQREANMTALQAIGPRKKPRLDGALGDGGTTASGNGTSATSNGSVSGRPQLSSRPRLKRVNIRDLVFLLEQEKESSRSTFLYKAYLK
ncbi:Differentially expressed in FDCP 8-like protein [Frankliniella fusca]|uniref:Differentially expressed in FDCP 8-like protein n=1 Tax=Frankliniella fusca TaxID=407009 RepID=A0AAE1HCR5_9NEOP|nr:Differentially expressed in FDCP 8-like protein [Frankliniella fusca]